MNCSIPILYIIYILRTIKSRNTNLIVGYNNILKPHFRLNRYICVLRLLFRFLYAYLYTKHIHLYMHIKYIYNMSDDESYKIKRHSC